MAISEDVHAVVEQRHGLGRIAAFDPKDQQHKMSAEPPIVVTVSKRVWEIDSTVAPLDQGQTSQCTAYGGEHFILAGPIQQPLYMTPAELYRANQLNDDWPGTETEDPKYQGSSVHALMKVLQAAGLIDRYVWAFGAETVRAWVLMKGPVVVGTDWLSGMEKASPAGFIRAKGNLLGGHCYLLIGADDKLRCPDGTTGAFIILNSWGKNWGYKNSGYAFISYRDMDKLIKHSGEAATAVEFSNTAPKPITGVIE